MDQKLKGNPLQQVITQISIRRKKLRIHFSLWRKRSNSNIYFFCSCHQLKLLAVPNSLFMFSSIFIFFFWLFWHFFLCLRGSVRIYANTLLLSARWRHYTVTEFSVPTCPKPPSLSLSLSAVRRRGSPLFVTPVFSLWDSRVSPSLVNLIFIPTFPNYTSVECLNSSFVTR